MGDVRTSQVAVETLSTQGPAPSERVTHVVVEALTPQAPSTAIRASQIVVEALSVNISPVVTLPGVGSLAMSGLSPAANIPQVLTVPVSTIQFSGAAAVVPIGLQLTPAVSALALLSLTPSVVNSGIPLPGSGSLSLAGVAPTVLAAVHSFVFPSSGGVSLTGPAPRLFMPSGDDFAALLLY